MTDLTDTDLALLTSTERDALARCAFVLPGRSEDLIAALKEIARLRRETRRLRSTVAELVDQYAGDGTKHGEPARFANGISTLEDAFAVFGLPDPCPVEQFDRVIRDAMAGAEG